MSRVLFVGKRTNEELNDSIKNFKWALMYMFVYLGYLMYTFIQPYNNSSTVTKVFRIIILVASSLMALFSVYYLIKILYIVCTSSNIKLSNQSLPIKTSKIASKINCKSCFTKNFYIINDNKSLSEKDISELISNLSNSYVSLSIISYNNWEGDSNANIETVTLEQLTSQFEKVQNSYVVKNLTILEVANIIFNRKVQELDLENISNLRKKYFYKKLLDMQRYIEINSNKNDEETNSNSILNMNHKLNSSSLHVDLLDNEKSSLYKFDFTGLFKLTSLSKLQTLVIENNLFSLPFLESLFQTINTLTLKEFKFYDYLSNSLCSMPVRLSKKLVELCLSFKIISLDITILLNWSNNKYIRKSFSIIDKNLKRTISFYLNIKSDFKSNIKKLAIFRKLNILTDNIKIAYSTIDYLGD